MSDVEFNSITCDYSGKELKIYSNGKQLPIHQKQLIALLVKAMQELNKNGTISDVKIQEYDDSQNLRIEDLLHNQKKLEIQVKNLMSEEYLELKKEKERIIARLLALESRMKM